MTHHFRIAPKAPTTSDGIKFVENLRAGDFDQARSTLIASDLKIVMENGRQVTIREGEFGDRAITTLTAPHEFAGSNGSSASRRLLQQSVLRALVEPVQLASPLPTIANPGPTFVPSLWVEKVL